jgi:putative addiction module killer protein
VFQINSTEAFDDWLSSLADGKGKARILARINSATFGNFGDVVPVGDGINEMRIHFGPGYRVYYMRRDTKVYLLLAGGEKSSQKRDIARAKTIARLLEGNNP